MAKKNADSQNLFEKWHNVSDTISALENDENEVIKRRDAALDEWEKSPRAKGLGFLPEHLWPKAAFRERRRVMAPFQKTISQLSNRIFLLRKEEKELREELRHSPDWTEYQLEWVFKIKLSYEASEALERLLHSIATPTCVLREESIKQLPNREQQRVRKVQQKILEAHRKPENRDDTEKVNRFIYEPFMQLPEEKRIELVTADDDLFSSWERRVFIPHLKEKLNFIESFLLSRAGLDSGTKAEYGAARPSETQVWGRYELQRRLKAIARQEKLEPTRPVSMKLVRRIARQFESEGYAYNPESIRKTFEKLGYIFES